MKTGLTAKRGSGLLAVLLLLSTSAAFAAVTGKIAGRVTEEETGAPLPGANVIVVGTTYGAAADVNGDYFIIGVPPGTYSLRVTMVGFREVVVEDVRVQSDLTTRIDVALAEATIAGEEIIVTAERPIIQPDETSSVQYLGVAELTELPVIEAKEGLFLQTGVLLTPEPVLVAGPNSAGRGEPRYAIRGGDQTEVKWFINGIRAHAAIEGRADQGGSYSNINLHAVQEIQIVTGGFAAEYGEAQSGVINVVTKEGGRNVTGSFEYLFGIPHQRHFGNYVFDRETQKEFQDHTLQDGSIDPDWLTPERESQIYDYRDAADHQLYVSLGGPLFDRKGVDARFFAAGQFKRTAYSLPRPRDHRELEDVLVSVSFNLPPDKKLRLDGLLSSVGHSTVQEVGDFTNQGKYYRGFGSLLKNDTYLFSGHWTHTLTQRSYYDLKLSYFLFDAREAPSEFTRLGESLNPDIWGFQRYNGFPEEPFDGWSFIWDQHQQVGDWSLTGSFNLQANSNNFIKAGFEGRYNTYKQLKAYRLPSFSMDHRYYLNRGLHETFHPLQFAAYVQDKMEFQGMILNLGLRYDLFDPNYSWFTTPTLFNLAVDPDFDPALDLDRDQVDENGRVKYAFENILKKPREPVRTYHMLSPRLGVSFPITDNSLLHFNYGHFFQMPPLDRMFELDYFRPIYIAKGNYVEDQRVAEEGGEPQHVVSNDGDPERVVFQSIEPLPPEKTIQFEVGITQNFGDLFVLDVTGFYKDVFDQSNGRVQLFDRRVYGYDPFRGSITPNVFFVSNFSGDYGDARGFEVDLRTLFSRYIALNANYSFSKSTEGRASPGRINYDENGEPEFIYDIDVARRLPGEKIFSRPHVLRANLYGRVPESTSGGFFKRSFRGVAASLLFKYISGRSFTFLGPDDPPDTRDNQRYPPIKLVDLRLEKTFTAGEHRITAFANVTNLFNTRNLRSFGDEFFDAEAVQRYVENGEISLVDAAGYDISWQTYFPPRQVFIGVRYNFR
jgi:outer membrane receptor for ferrienterochelin and colicin